LPANFRFKTPGRRVSTRSSPRERGYDALWDRKADSYRRKHPFCARCEQIGRVRFARVVDHKYPVQDGGEVHCNLDGVWGLCFQCHGWKQNLELYARKTGQMERIVEWCDNPASRPFNRGDINAR
jgi:5-methylcytosine-specific restriction endonuclease McrA